MNEAFELDIDRERVCLDSEWLSRDDLTARIKEKVAAGDFRVARLSLALESLDERVSSLVTVSLRLTPEVMEAFERVAAHEEAPLSLVLRRGLVHYLASEDAASRLFKARRAEISEE